MKYMDFDTNLSTSGLYITEIPSVNTTDLTVGIDDQELLYDIIVPFLGALIIIINGAVVVSSNLLLRRKVELKATYLFLGNIAAADVLTAVATLAGLYLLDDILNQTVCEIFLGCIVGATVVSIWSIALIAGDRFLFIVYGMKYKQWMFTSRARILICLVWIVGLGVGFLPAMGWANSIDESKECWFIKIATRECVLFIISVGFIPLMLIFGSYSLILFKALRKISQLQKAYEKQIAKTTGANPSADEQQNKKKAPSHWKAIKVVLFTTGAFCITWVPYFVGCVMYILCSDDCEPIVLTIETTLALLGFSNSLLNPIIYAWWHPGFRDMVMKMCCRKQRQRKYEMETSSTDKLKDKNSKSTTDLLTSDTYI